MTERAKACTAEQAASSLEKSPLTLGELEVAETLAANGVLLRPDDYMRLVVTVREQHEALEAAEELLQSHEAPRG